MPEKQKRYYLGFTCGAFDLLHAGHIMMLKECKYICEFLIVGLQVDPSIDRPEKNAPIQTLEERQEMLRAIRYIDQIIVYKTEKDLVQLLKKIEPDVRIIDADWRGKEYTGHELPIPTYFNTRDHGWSTSNLRDRIYLAEKMKRERAE